MPKLKRSKKSLIKVGSPHPLFPSHKFKSAHLTDREADKAEETLLEKPSTESTRRIHVPQQHLVYAKSRRITPKTPRLRK